MLRNNYPYLIKKPAENIEKHVTCSENQLLKVIFLHPEDKFIKMVH